MSKFVLTVYIGRFSPWHNGHAEVLDRARKKSDAVLILIGSTNWAANPKNPWTFIERKDVIDKYVQNRIDVQHGAPVHVDAIRDYLYNDQMWISNVRAKISSFINKSSLKNVEVRITGSDRDSSTFYLKLFPDYILDLINEDMEVSRFLTATTVREIYFGRTLGSNKIDSPMAEVLLKSFVPIETINFLKYFESTNSYSLLVKEHNFNINYRKPYEVRDKKVDKVSGECIDPGLPYDVIFHTVDNVVFQTGHVLLVKRRSEPGKGLLALPGGFVNSRERLLDAAIRELREETRLKVPDPILRSSIVFNENFDHPDRSLRGRTITTTFFYKLPDHVVDNKIVLPVVKGSDDAEKAMWVPINEILNNVEFENRFFEDHHLQIEMGLGKLI